MLSPWLYEYLAPYVADIAQATYRKLGVERDDVVQELWLHVLDNEKWIAKYAENDSVPMIRKTLNNAAQVFAQADKAQKNGYKLQDLYWYDSTVIRDILPAVWNRGDWQSMGQVADDGVRGKSPANEGGNRVAMCADVRRVVFMLPPDDQELLRRRFGLGTELEALVEQLAAFTGHTTTPEALRKRCDRLVRRLLDMLGGERPQFEGPGARRAINNATALAITGEGVA